VERSASGISTFFAAEYLRNLSKQLQVTGGDV
jgi:hypothetical protein